MKTEDVEKESQNGEGKHEEEIEWVETDNERQMRELIFRTDDRPEVIVPVPEWKLKILIRSMSGTERSQFLFYQANLSDKSQDYIKKLYFRIVLLCCYHPKTHKPIFQPTDQDSFMDEKNGAIIEMLAMIGQQLSHLDNSTREAARKNYANILKASGISSFVNGSTTKESEIS